MQVYISTGALVGVQLDEQGIASIISAMRPDLRTGEYLTAMAGAVVGIGLAVSTGAPDYHDDYHDGRHEDDYGRDYDYSSGGGPSGHPYSPDYSYGHDHSWWDGDYAGGDGGADDPSTSWVISIVLWIVAMVVVLPMALFACSKPRVDTMPRHQRERPTVQTVHQKLRQMQLDVQVCSQTLSGLSTVNAWACPSNRRTEHALMLLRISAYALLQSIPGICLCFWAGASNGPHA